MRRSRGSQGPVQAGPLSPGQVLEDGRPARPDAGGMSRTPIPAAFSRRTSMILRMGSFLLGTSVLPRMTTVEVVIQEGRVPALVDQGPP